MYCCIQPHSFFLFLTLSLSLTHTHTHSYTQTNTFTIGVKSSRSNFNTGTPGLAKIYPPVVACMACSASHFAHCVCSTHTLAASVSVSTVKNKTKKEGFMCVRVCIINAPLFVCPYSLLLS